MNIDNTLFETEALFTYIKNNLDNIMERYNSYFASLAEFEDAAAKYGVSVGNDEYMLEIDLSQVIGLCDGIILEIQRFHEDYERIRRSINATLGGLNVNFASITHGYANSMDLQSYTHLLKGSINDKSKIGGYSFTLNGECITWYGGSEYANLDEFYKALEKKYPSVDINKYLKVLITTDDTPIAWVDYNELFKPKNETITPTPNSGSSSKNDNATSGESSPSKNNNDSIEKTEKNSKAEEKKSGDAPKPSNTNKNNNSNPQTDSNGIIDTSSSNYSVDGYSNLTDEEINTLAYIAYHEQGSVEGAKIELSLMCNLYEKNKSNYSSVYDYVQNSGWFGSATGSSKTPPSDAYTEIAYDVLVNGNHYLPSNVVEHDCISDLSYAKNGDSYINVSDRSSYIPGETILKNVYGATYVFVGFAPNGGDPFGYLV